MTHAPHPEIRISPAFAAAGVQVRLGCLAARVTVRADDPATKAALAALAGRLAEELRGAVLAELPGIAEARRAFRALGKDPSRYRPSSEALLRRVAQGKGLFNVNNLVDTNNLVSLESRLPAGAYDLARIEGAFEAGLELRVAGPEDGYEAIARGPFNLSNLPALCDAAGPFGSPTSDSVRTMVSERCRETLLVLYAFDAAPGLEAALDAAEAALVRYCDAAVTARWRVEA
jgi:DNA/RNA-binding domain of Phe-tRNA-synthetase-like protein